MKFFSCVEWPVEVKNLNSQITKDEHGTLLQADGVCKLLKENGFGGNRQHFPIRVWIEDELGTIIDKSMLRCMMSPNKFVWEKYIGKVGFAVCQVCDDAYTEPLKLNPDVTFIGWCPANIIQIRQRDSGFVVMVEMDGEDFWFHTLCLPVKA